MIFYVQYEHMMENGSGLSASCRFLKKGLESGRPQDYEQFWEACESRLDTRTCQRYHTQMAGICVALSEDHRCTVWQPITAVSPLALMINLTEPRGENSVCVSRGCKIPLTGCKVLGV